MSNLQHDGWDLTDLKYIALSEREKENYRLEKGDILFNRTNSKELVGKCEVFRESGHWVFASYLVRVRVNMNDAEPQFVSDFINTQAGRIQIDRVSRQIIGMTNVNAQEIRDFVIPLPSLDIQRALVSEMEFARGARKAKLAEADALLAGLDDFLLDQLGLTPTQPDGRLSFALPLKVVAGSKQIGADYFHPERLNALKAIQKAKKAKRAERLEKIGDFHRNAAKEFDPEQYLGLAGVQSETGELANANDEPGMGQSFRFQEKDVLFARLRPYLNKVWLAERSGVCSTEFHVIRIKEEQREDILPGYLAAVLRSSVVVAQTKHMMTGNTHPRLANGDVVDLFIPIPEWDVQQTIVEELRRRRLEARRLREEAAREWEAAKARFEEKLLGEEAKT